MQYHIKTHVIPYLGGLKPQLGQKGCTLAHWIFFDRFLKVDGSIWAVTVLDEQGVLLRCSGHPKRLYLEHQKYTTKMGPWKFINWGPIAIFGPYRLS